MARRKQRAVRDNGVSDFSFIFSILGNIRLQRPQRNYKDFEAQEKTGVQYTQEEHEELVELEGKAKSLNAEIKALVEERTNVYDSMAALRITRQSGFVVAEMKAKRAFQGKE